MLPVLFWLASEESNRRHERRTRQELTQAFDDAWALYKSEADTPFRRGSVNFHSAPTEKHIADKLLAAVKSDTCLIYFYAEGFTTCEASSTCVKLSGGALLDLRELIHEVDCASIECNVFFIDVPGAASALRDVSLSRSALVCRSAKDFIRSTPTGSDPLSGAFADYFGAAIRHMPIFTCREIVDAVNVRLSDAARVRGGLLDTHGKTECLNTKLSNFFPRESPISSDEIENLKSDNSGSFEDGLQSIWGAIDKPEKFKDARALAQLLAVTKRFPNAAKSARLLQKRGADHPVVAPESVETASDEFVKSILERMIYVPGGVAVLGSNPEKDEYALSQEIPEHTVSHRAFSLSSCHITVREWQIFQEASGGMLDHRSSTEEFDFPVRYISFFDACRFADWIDRSAKVHDLIEPDSKIMLPSEAEWEIAARGRRGNIYPWGNDFRPVCNFRDNSGDKVRVVGSFSPEGDSPFGFKDMAGNVWEWTRSLWGRSGRSPEFCYPYHWDDGRENLFAHSDIRRVVRGGSYYYFDWCLRCATRNIMFPDTRHSGGGFRLLRSGSTGAEVSLVISS